MNENEFKNAKKYFSRNHKNIFAVNETVFLDSHQPRILSSPAHPCAQTCRQAPSGDNEFRNCNKFANDRPFPELITLRTEDRDEGSLKLMKRSAFMSAERPRLGLGERFLCETKAFSGNKKFLFGKKRTKDQYRNQYRHSSSAAPATIPTLGHAFKNSLIT